MAAKKRDPLIDNFEEDSTDDGFDVEDIGDDEAGEDIIDPPLMKRQPLSRAEALRQLREHQEMERRKNDPRWQKAEDRRKLRQDEEEFQRLNDPKWQEAEARRMKEEADGKNREDALTDNVKYLKKSDPLRQSDADLNVPGDNIATASPDTKPKPSTTETGKANDAAATKNSDPGKTREPDPLKRGSVGDLNKAPEERQPSELRRRFQEGKDRLGKGMDDLRQARDLANQKIGAARDVLADPAQAAKDAATRQGKKLAKEGARRAGQAAKAGAKATGRLAAQGARMLGQLALQGVSAAVTAIVGFLGPWGAAILALVVAVGVGVAFLWPKGGASTPPQIADTSKPAIVASIDRLAALAGDQAALARQIEDRTSGFEQVITRAREESASAPLATDIARELDLATVHLNTVRAGGASMGNEERSRLMNAIFYSLQRAIALYRGVNIESGSDIAAKAAEAAGQAGSWVYTNNEQGTGSLPLRDGSNVVGNKRGCNSSGFVIYAVRDSSKCAQCVSPTLDKFAAIFSLFQSVDVSGTEAGGSVNKGDILAMKKPNSQYLEGFIVINPQVQRPQDTELAYCGVNGPAKAKYSEITAGTFSGRNGDGVRTPAFRLRLRTATRVEAPAAAQ